MCFQKPYWESRNVDYDSEEKFIIDDFSSIKKAKAFLDISKEDFVAYAQVLKKVKYIDETNVLLSVFEDNMNAVDMYPDYDFDKELAEALKKLVGDEKPLLYIDAPKMREYKRFEFDSRRYMLLLESLLYYDGDWILTFKNEDVEDDSDEEIEKYTPKNFMNFMKTSKRLLYKYKFTTTDKNIRNRISFITTIDFDSWLFELSLERWIITGGAVYFNSISSIKYNCIRDFINGNKRKEFIFIWHECHLFINKLWSNRFDSESTFCNNSLDMGSSFSCVGTFICNTDKKSA